MRNYESIKKNLCDKLKSWGIDPVRLIKAIGVFLAIIVLIKTFVIFSKLFEVLFGVLLITAIFVAIIALIYNILE